MHGEHDRLGRAGARGVVVERDPGGVLGRGDDLGPGVDEQPGERPSRVEAAWGVRHHAHGAGGRWTLRAEGQLAPSGAGPMRELGDGEVGDGIGAAGFGVGEQAAQRLELGAHEPGPVQPRDRCGLVAAEQGGAIRGRGGQLGTGGEREHGQDRLVRAERRCAPGRRAGRRRSRRRPAVWTAAHSPTAMRSASSAATSPAWRDSASASAAAAASASTPTSSLTASSAPAQRPRLRGRRLDGGVRLAQGGQRGVGPLAQLGIVHRAGGSAGAAGRSTGGRQVGHLQRAAAAHQPRRPRPPRR